MQKIYKFITVSCVSILLTACATGYHATDWHSRGYSEMALNEDTYDVSFSGNGFTAQNTVQSYLLRRCAELTLNKGYRYFTIMTGNTSVDSSVSETPTTVEVRNNGFYQGYGSGTTAYYGNYAHSNFGMVGNSFSTTRATINPGTQYRINKYTSHAIIKMFKNNKNIPQAFNAKMILSNFENR